MRSAVTLCQSVVEASVGRSFKGPRQPGWNWFLELGTQILKRHLAVAFKMRDVNAARSYLDSVAVDSTVSAVDVNSLSLEKFRGSWFIAKGENPRVIILYFHGGGYSFYPKGYARFIALITQAAKSRTFALDYRLSPENRFPAQLEDALNAYRWLLEVESKLENLVVAGDSAGGNLALALLLAARDAKLPLPALAITLSPATGFDRNHRAMASKQNSDWLQQEMLEQWADWFCDSAQRQNVLVSPVLADLRGLPPIYIQAGRAEILYESIRAFADRASAQGADIVFESWEHMNHDFQLFGPYVPQSAEALRRIGQVIDARVRGRKYPEDVSVAGS
jgi:monoterpene epsilon-lactone hydrolase